MLTREEDYAHQQPSLTAKKMRLLESIWTGHAIRRRAGRAPAQQTANPARTRRPARPGLLDNWEFDRQLEHMDDANKQRNVDPGNHQWASPSGP